MDNTRFEHYYEKIGEERHIRRIGFLLSLYYAKRFEIVTPNIRYSRKGSGTAFQISDKPTVKRYKMLSTYSARNAHNIDEKGKSILCKGIRNSLLNNDYISVMDLDRHTIGKKHAAEQFSVDYIRLLMSVSEPLTASMKHGRIIQ